MSPRYRLSDPPFAPCGGRGVVVAVVDSGIRYPHPHIGSVRGGATLSVDSSDPAGPSVVVDEGSFEDVIGHGTAVAAAIQDLAPEAELVAIKVFDRSLTTSAELLAAAIDEASARGARIVNLSVGTTNEARAPLLAAAVGRAIASGAIVVAARESADGVACFPGALPNVIGVVADWSLERTEIDVPDADGATVVGASPYPRSIPGVPKERNLSGVSFAVANASGFVARACDSRFPVGDGTRWALTGAISGATPYRWRE